MNYSIATADRNTHVKIAVLALIASVVVVVSGVSVRVDAPGLGAAHADAGKVGKPTQFATRSGIEFR